jgi:hypothetical protein
MPGDGNMKIPDELEQKILESGIFKLGDKSKPIGLIKLIPGKKTLSTASKCHDYEPRILKSLILDLSHEIKQYLYNDDKDNLFEKGPIYFKNELISVLESWGISPSDLKPQYDDFIKKAEKHLNKKLSIGTKSFKRKGIMGKYRRDYLISRLHKIFEDRTRINKTDILHYLVYILIACAIEKDLPQPVFKKIEKAFYRYQGSHKSYEYIITK